MGYSTVPVDSKAYKQKPEPEEWGFSTKVRNALFPYTPGSLFYLATMFVIIYKLDMLTLPTKSLGLVFHGFGEAFFLDVLATAFVVLPLLLFVVVATRFLLSLCLSYTGWLNEEMGKRISIPTRIFMAFIAVLNKLPLTSFSFQGILPKLPLPTVERSVEKLLDSLVPLLSDEEMKEMRELADDFKQNLAPELQRKLWFKWLTSDNYVTDWWKEIIYMRYRKSLLTSNVGCADLVSNPPTSNQAARAATVIILRLQFCIDFVEKHKFKPVTMGGIPMCSKQYDEFHRTIRAPNETSDVMIRLPPAQHIAVYSKGCWYKINIYHGPDEMISTAELEIALQWILDHPGQPDEGEQKLSALTAGPRDLWARIRKDKFGCGLNKQSLWTIESALDIVYLDDEEVPDYAPDDPAKYEREYARALHGDGYKLWCDKPSIYIVNKKGRFSANSEHSVCDALITVHIREYVKYHESFRPAYGPDGHCVGDTRNPPAVERLRWDLDQETQSAIGEAHSVALGIANDFANCAIIFTDYGKDFIKKAKVSPDAYIQMALQLAYYRDQGKFELTYEAAITRLFREGRTETVRSCTPYSCAFVNAMLDSDGKDSVRMTLLRDACSRHQQTTRDAMAGKGSDRHLFALYVLSKYYDKQSPFLEKAFGMNFALSTSQTPQHQTVEWASTLNKERDQFWPAGGFSCPDGSNYGVCYTVAPTGDMLSFHITTWKSNKKADIERFRHNVIGALREMRRMVEAVTA